VRSRIASALSVVTALVVLPSCTGRPTGSDSVAASPRPVRCEIGFAPPAEFDLQETIVRKQGDHMGIRETYLDEAGRLLYLFAGIEGEFGEGAATAESVPLAGGTIGELAGEGLDWTLVWQTPGPCSSRAAVGNGFSRRGFVGTMRSAGVLAD